MAIELRTAEVEINQAIITASPQVLADCDIIVPDVKPDVLKILQVDASAVLLQKELQQDRIVLSGRVDYKILYVPESASGVKGVTASAPFSHVEELKGVKSSMRANISCDVEHVEFNLVNSRKISVKTILGINADISTKVKLEAVTDIEGEGVQVKVRPIKAYNTIVDKEGEIFITDQLTLPMGKPAIGALLKTDVTIKNKDIKVINNKVIAKGELSLCSLYNADNGEIAFMEQDIPFTEIIDVPGISEGLFTETDFVIKEAYFKESADSDGDIRLINAEVKVAVNILASEIISFETVSDAYSTQCDLSLKQQRYRVAQIIDSVNVQATLKDIIPVPDNIPEVLQVYNVISKPYVSDTVVEGGRVNVSGIVDVYVLYLSSKEDSPVYSFRHELPFNQSIESQNADGCKVSAKAEVSHVSYSINAASEIETRFIMSYNVKLTKTNDTEVVCDVSEKDLATGKKPSIVLYFVQKGDNIWDIAKRYRTKIEAIESVNRIEAGTRLCEGMQLLIPSR